MSKWRPENWTNPYQDKEGCWERLCFERGADAMLEALRKDGVSSKEIGNTISGNRLSVWVDKHKIGTWVFIPDDKES